MSSYSTQYRKDHPEWREAEKIRNNEREEKKYNNDPDYKEQVKKRALERYYRMKEWQNWSCYLEAVPRGPSTGHKERA
jgi:hypothetical protein